jgi:hypothetical protein
MVADPQSPSASTILAYGAAVAIGIFGLGYCLKIVLSVLGTSLGLTIATATTGLATAGAVASWVAPVAAAGVAATGTVLTVHLLVKLAEEVHDKPYEWTLPLVAAIAGVLVNLSKDLVFQNTAMRLLFGGMTALWIVVAGALYKRQGWRWKCSAILLYLLPPLCVLGWKLSKGLGGTKTYFSTISRMEWSALASFAGHRYCDRVNRAFEQNRDSVPQLEGLLRP